MCVVGNIPVCLSLDGKKQPHLIITTIESWQFTHEIIKVKAYKIYYG